VLSLLDAEPLDVMIVVGGYNSSNTCNLAKICAARVPTFHIADPECLVTAGEIRHRPVTVSPGGSAVREVTSGDWLPPAGPVVIGLTAGASTPNNIVGQVIERLDGYANLP
jgi:4-hydroxy-3-methylbut-2-enyl diphosphate reductase